MEYLVKRLIEVDLPIRTISAHAQTDKNIRKGHLHNMHIWWATRPLASCRAVTLATIFPDPVDPKCPAPFCDTAREVLATFTSRSLKEPRVLRQALLGFIADFSAWDNSINPTFLEAARRLVRAAHPDGAPVILDPFAGAGSIPFEALRVGAQSFAGDLNPVAILLNKVSQEYMPRYKNRLAEGVEKWGSWVLEYSRKRLESYYPTDIKGNMPLAYIWARTVICEGPGCGAEVPLLGLLWLSHKARNLVAMRYRGNQETKEVSVDVFKPKSESQLQSPISKRFAATCPCCEYTTPYKRVREQLRARDGGARDSRLLAVVMSDSSGNRSYRTPEEQDINVAKKAAREIKAIRAGANKSLDPVPDEPYPD